MKASKNVCTNASSEISYTIYNRTIDDSKKFKMKKNNNFFIHPKNKYILRPGPFETFIFIVCAQILHMKKKWKKDSQ